MDELAWEGRYDEVAHMRAIIIYYYYYICTQYIKKTAVYSEFTLTYKTQTLELLLSPSVLVWGRYSEVPTQLLAYRVGAISHYIFCCMMCWNVQHVIGIEHNFCIA